ncbi:hypothetical protein BDK51DRAFT_45831 [Blyttiomyces helicus]|uniref:Uncharacterized protein n=1 Tax=Blyttiomyces helicus TaxID=388810 RepID=A0A4P9W995_9FUNG|nr:hypothetical protein BDK51DRAFT_45831 [Blyttiomyces helicus]|eukprot:RKO88075.1 hypothetical protein BDK51DRAFT_45831 [Blyttiomyces helicus]
MRTARKDAGGEEGPTTFFRGEKWDWREWVENACKINAGCGQRSQAGVERELEVVLPGPQDATREMRKLGESTTCSSCGVPFRNPYGREPRQDGLQHQAGEETGLLCEPVKNRRESEEWTSTQKKTPHAKRKPTEEVFSHVCNVVSIVKLNPLCRQQWSFVCMHVCFLPGFGFEQRGAPVATAETAGVDACGCCSLVQLLRSDRRPQRRTACGASGKSSGRSVAGWMAPSDNCLEEPPKEEGEALAPRPESTLLAPLVADNWLPPGKMSSPAQQPLRNLPRLPRLKKLTAALARLLRFRSPSKRSLQILPPPQQPKLLSPPSPQPSAPLSAPQDSGLDDLEPPSLETLLRQGHWPTPQDPPTPLFPLPPATTDAADRRRSRASIATFIYKDTDSGFGSVERPCSADAGRACGEEGVVTAPWVLVWNARGEEGGGEGVRVMGEEEEEEGDDDGDAGVETVEVETLESDVETVSVETLESDLEKASAMPTVNPPSLPVALPPTTPSSPLPSLPSSSPPPSPPSRGIRAFFSRVRAGLKRDSPAPTFNPVSVSLAPIPVPNPRGCLSMDIDRLIPPSNSRSCASLDLARIGGVMRTRFIL